MHSCPMRLPWSIELFTNCQKSGCNSELEIEGECQSSLNLFKFIVGNAYRYSQIYIEPNIISSLTAMPLSLENLVSFSDP